MKTSTRKLFIPRQVQLLVVVSFIVIFLLAIIGQVPSIVSQLQAGQDAGPSLRYLASDTIVPIVVVFITLLLLPYRDRLARAFMAVFLGVFAIAVASISAGLSGAIYHYFVFSGAVFQDNDSIARINETSNILYYASMAILYIAFFGLLLFWRKKNIWNVK